MRTLRLKTKFSSSLWVESDSESGSSTPKPINGDNSDAGDFFKCSKDEIFYSGNQK
jgi:hypothetical protein